jgi:hypothetical protein
MLYGIGRGDERHGRDDHLVPSTDSECQHPKVQRSRAGRDATDVLGAGVRLEHPLEALHPRACPYPTGTEAGRDLGNRILVDDRTSENKKLGTH